MRRSHCSHFIDCTHRSLNKKKLAFHADRYASLDQALSPTAIDVPMAGCTAVMYKELFKLNVLQPWADELKLRVEPQSQKGNLSRVLVFGPGMATGEFFRRIGDYFDAFKDR